MKTHRNTIQRQVLIEEIRKTRRHLTAGELYETVRQRLPHISLGTVYRNLEYLAESGEVCKLGGAGQETRFDGITEKHSHFRCRECGRIDDADASLTVVFQGEVANRSGWILDGPRVEFEGVCPDCLARTATGQNPGTTNFEGRARGLR